MTPSRRKALMLGAGAVLAVPALHYANWARQDHTRADFAETPPAPPAGERSWSNWSGSQSASPKDIAAPDTVEGLAAFMRQTEGPIRPVGSGHSFTGLVPSEGVMVDVGKLAGLLDYDTAKGTARLGAGTRLRHAARLLDDVDLGFHNLPDIDVQTLAGSFSTATHGTGQNLAALHDHVAGIRLVTPTGDILSFDRDTAPDLFGAARVSLGALGVITDYTLALRPSYALRRRVWVTPAEDAIANAETNFAKHRNFEFYYVPNTGYAAEIAHDLHEGPVDGLNEEEDTNELLEALVTVRDHLGWWPWLRRKALSAGLPKGQIEDVNETYWKMLSTTRRHKFNEIEYHLPIETGFDALREVAAVLESNPANFFPMEMRRTAPDDAWLSPFNDGPRYSIAVHADAREEFSYFFSEIEPIFRKHGGRPHWGKMHSLGAADLRELYPQFDAFNALRQTLDPAGKMLNPHLSHLFGVT